MPPKGFRQSCDPAWAYGQQIIVDNDHNIKRNYCNATMHASINRLKYHLAKIPGNGVGCCQSCPDEVTTKMVVALESIKEASSKRARRKDEIVGIGKSSSQSETQFPSPGIGNSSSSVVANKSITSSFFRPCTTPGSQPTLDSFNEKKRKEADMVVRRFWYHKSFNYTYSYFY